MSELFDLPDFTDITQTSDGANVSDALESIENTKEVIRQVDEAIDKIDIALPTVRDLEASDKEMDELAELAKDKFQDLFDLGLNMDPRFSGPIFQTAGTLLGHAISAKTAKVDKKLRMVNLQLQKAKLDNQMSKGKSDDTPVDGQGILLDRNALLEQILQKNKK